ncbi:aspartate--ammonia ligase [Mycoplasmopsis opalescens]|uniref:aspartate--ammonia ligase n=1 Tax=Mycoplasmopsis opalescens TaxID=114886 RepID=UPI0004A73F16|nr:amino acid--tRNA ligase-related protein [Mycoplasmopsis opalescens]
MYKSKLSIKETQLAIQNLKFYFTKRLNKNLNLVRVSAPLFVTSESKINDGLNGETPVLFLPPALNKQVEIVHSLAKWKRTALKKYNFNLYEGIWTDMNAIRQHEVLDNTHSIYVDQWDWEMIIDKNDRTTAFLEKIVDKIYSSILEVESKIISEFPTLKSKLPKKLFYISTNELEKKYPDLSPEQREDEIVKKHKAVFISEIGFNLKNGKPHSSRAFDYDDWLLNGDLIFYDELNDRNIEISSMGIRVNRESLLNQAKFKNIDPIAFSSYHMQILNNELPLTIGGGIGQSRLCMYILEKKHIGEVQASLWPDEVIESCAKENINIL